MKKIDIVGSIKRQLEKKTKPPKSEPKARKQWFGLKDRLERALRPVSETRNHVQESLKKQKDE